MRYPSAYPAPLFFPEAYCYKSTSCQVKRLPKRIQGEVLPLIRFLLIFLLSIGFISCDKEPEPAEPEFADNIGYVKEYHTNKAIANAEIGIYDDPGYNKLLDSAHSDANGRFKTIKNFKYEAAVLVAKDGYYLYTYGMAPTNRDEKKNIFYLDKPGYILLHFKSDSSHGPYDRLNLGEYSLPVDIIGNHIDTFICCIQKPGYKEYTIPVFVKRYPEQEYKARPEYCSPKSNDTLLVNIIY
jgi:hypothetical protein